MTYQDILSSCFERATSGGRQDTGRIDADSLERIRLVSRTPQNRACVRLVMTCALAKAHDPGLDARKPYTEIGTADSFSGRTLDERFLSPFIMTHHLPCNPTTAFLTPALRNMNTPLTRNLNLQGRPQHVYAAALIILDDIEQGRLDAAEVLTAIIDHLIGMRDEQQMRLMTLTRDLSLINSDVPLTAEQIVSLLGHHLSISGASRLPVLIVAAAYHAAAAHLGERASILHPHQAADKATGALGDVEIFSIHDPEHLSAVYEVKFKPVTLNDVHGAAVKLRQHPKPPAHFVFITTEPIDSAVSALCLEMSEEQPGTEFVVLDCISFIRHYLHLFHGLRATFLDMYQAILLAEPESAVSHTVKEAFLALRLAASLRA
jgi:DNA adenine methylase